MQPTPTPQIDLSEAALITPGHAAVLAGDRGALQVRHSFTERPLFGFVGSAGFMLVGVLMTVVLLRYLITETRLSTGGTLTEAQVVERTADIDPEDPDDIRDAAWTIVYRFTVGGETYTQTQEILPDVFVATRGMEAVPVRYWPPDPALNRLAVPGAERFNTGGVVVLGIAIGLAYSVGSVFLRAGVLAGQRAQTLRERGQAVTAQVTNTRHDEATATLTYTFRSPYSGELITDTVTTSAEAVPESRTIVVWAASDDLYQVL